MELIIGAYDYVVNKIIEAAVYESEEDNEEVDEDGGETDEEQENAGQKRDE